jgi:probable rRNA maturation factor
MVSGCTRSAVRCHDEAMSPNPPAHHRPRRQGPDDGVITVFVADEQHDEPVDGDRWSALAEAVLGAEGIVGEAELSVLFVDEAHITDLNERFMGHAGPTDVLSFPLDAVSDHPGTSATAGAGEGDVVAEVVAGGGGPLARTLYDPDDQPLLLGDVVICPAVAARQASAHAGSYEDEIALLLVHGVLHVLGMDHAEAAPREAMQARERALLAELHGPLAADPWAP